MSFEPGLRPSRYRVRSDADSIADAAVGAPDRPLPGSPTLREVVPIPRKPRPEVSAADAVSVHRFVARRVANHADAADIAQQALLLAWTKRSTCRGETVSAWLLTIARHLIIDHYRARGRGQGRFVDVEALAETEPALRTPPDTAFAVCECRARLKTWLDCITERLRLEEQVAVLLADVYGHRDKESAALLQMSVPSFKLLLHGSRKRLRAIAGGSCTLLGEDAQPDSPVGSAGAPCGKDACCGKASPPTGPPTYRLGVICGGDRLQLLHLRKRLLEGLEEKTLV